MKKEFVDQMNEMFIKHSDLKDDYYELYEFVKTLKEANRLQEEIIEINKKLTELNTEKETKKK